MKIARILDTLFWVFPASALRKHNNVARKNKAELKTDNDLAINNFRVNCDANSLKPLVTNSYAETRIN